MGRLLVSLVAIVVLGIVCFGIYVGIEHLRNGRVDRQRARKQRNLAKFAPAVLHGSPLVDVIVDQGRQLEAAAAIFRELTADDITTATYLPTTHHQRVRDWLNTHQERKTSS